MLLHYFLRASYACQMPTAECNWLPQLFSAFVIFKTYVARKIAFGTVVVVAVTGTIRGIRPARCTCVGIALRPLLQKRSRCGQLVDQLLVSWWQRSRFRIVRHQARDRIVQTRYHRSTPRNRELQFFDVLNQFVLLHGLQLRARHSRVGATAVAVVATTCCIVVATTCRIVATATVATIPALRCRLLRRHIEIRKSQNRSIEGRETGWSFYGASLLSCIQRHLLVWCRR